VKKNEKMSGPLGGIFLTHTVYLSTGYPDLARWSVIKSNGQWGLKFL